MSYANGEAKIETLIQTVSGFNSNTVSRKNWGILNRGAAASYAILRRGSFTRLFQSPNRAFTTWSTLCDVWQRYKDETQTANDLDDRCQAIIDKIDVYRKLGDTSDEIVDAKVARGDEPREVWLKGGAGPAWLVATLTIEWKEEQEITFAE